MNENEDEKMKVYPELKYIMDVEKANLDIFKLPDTKENLLADIEKYKKISELPLDEIENIYKTAKKNELKRFTTEELLEELLRREKKK